MKTLHLTNYWHERSGGIATFYRELMQAANRHQQHVVLVLPGVRDEIQEVSNYIRIYKLAAPSSPLNHEYRTIYPREFLLPESKVQKILAKERPSLVEICDKYSLVHLGPLLRLRLARGVTFRPVVVGLSCERMDENFAIYVSRSWWARAFVQQYMRHVYFPAFDHHIAVSENTAAELKAVADGHIARRGVWIRPMGVDVDGFSPAQRSASLRKRLLHHCADPEHAILLLYVGRLVPEKNLELLIATMAELEKAKQSFRLILVGDGIARESLERAARAQVPNKVIFLGHIRDREELSRVYASCNIFVHPNPTEPFGIAPLEAMASGLALVAPDRGGITSYASDMNAYLATATPEAFAQAILRAVENKEETGQKIRAAQETAKLFAWPRVTDSFLSLYETICKLQAGMLAIESASPAFVSSDAQGSYARHLSFASNLAQASFSTYARLGQIVKLIGSRKNHYHIELEGTQFQ